MPRTFAPRAGDWGTVLRFRVLDDGRPEDLSAFDTLDGVLKRGTTTVATRAAAVDAADDRQGLFTFAEGDLDTPGEYSFEVHYGDATGEWTTEPLRFTVHARL